MNRTNVIPITPEVASFHDTCRVCRRHVERCTCFLGPVSVPLHREFLESLVEDARIADQYQAYAMYALFLSGLLIGFLFGAGVGFLIPR